MMRQYMAFKKKHRDAILLFRMGDFYEVFFEDAKTCARVLGLALTSREKGEDAVPMAGFPHHAAESYIKRLIQAGHRVAVCEQVQDPKEAKGLLERDVTRVITAGTLTEEGILDQGANNFLAAASWTDSRVGLAWVDLSTGKFELEEAPPESLADSLNRISPSEFLLPDQDEGEQGADLVRRHLAEGCQITRRPPWEFSTEEGRRTLNEHFQTATLDGFGCEGFGPAIGAAGAVMSYLQETQRMALGHITRLEPFSGSRYLLLDTTTQRSLELVQTMRRGERHGSLLGVLDETKTPMGARLLRRWILTPLKAPAEIEERLDAVEELFGSKLLRLNLANVLRNVYDLERLITRIYCGRASARDLVSLGNSLRHLPELKGYLGDRSSGLLREICNGLDTLPEVVGLVAAAINPDPPAQLTEGGIIRDGYSPQLDELRQTTRHGKDWIARLEAEETRRSAIPSLKVGFNKVFGYYIEVTNAHRDKVPDNYIRKQTLKNAERYVTPELKEWESKVLTASDRAKELEYELFQGVREEIGTYTNRIQATAEAVARLDVLLSLAMVAADCGYIRPRITDDKQLRIVAGRHPVLEQVLNERFVPNSLDMDGEDVRVFIITGPNMSGKSVYIRQNALLVLMAQMGSFVPVEEATVGAVDRIFTRVGASEEQLKGQSTFMVEMIEVANILNNATERSLVILDELGRGTSTYDGVSIAWATSEYLHDRIGARTICATHYHEMAQLAETHEAVRNLNVAVREWQDEVIFLHRIVPGATDQSYGIHVARLAGVPNAVIDRARQILSHLERNAVEVGGTRAGRPESEPPKPHPRPMQTALFKPLEAQIRADLLGLNIPNMTPLEALAKLEEIKRRLLEG